MSPGVEPRPPGPRSLPLLRTALALKLALLRGSLRSGPGSTGRRVGLVVGAVGGGLLAVLVVAGLTLSRAEGGDSSGDLSGDLTVLLFCALVTLWVVLPLLTFASDDLLDPSRLVLLPLTGRQRVLVMGAGALVGVPAAVTLVLALGLLPATTVGPGSLVVGVLAALLELALCVSASRAVASLLAGVLRSRRGRDVGVALTALLVVGAQLVNPLIQLTLGGGAGANDNGGASGLLRGPASVLARTPPGWLATAPTRGPLGAVVSLLGGAAVVALLAAVWGLGVRRSLERTAASTTRPRRHTELVPRWVPLPAGRAGAVAAKDLRYLVREPRRLVGMVTTTVVPVAAVVAPTLSTGGPGRGSVFVVCLVAMLAAVTAGNRFGLDGSATWLLLATATAERDARRDLAGGELAVAIATVPLVVVLGGVLAVVTDGVDLLPAALGTALGLLAVQVAISSVMAVRSAYPVPVRGSGFGGGSGGQGCAAGLVVIVALLSGAGLCLPLLGLLVPALVTGAPAWGLALLVVGPLYGLGVGVWLRRWAARYWSARAPEVLQTISAVV